jgi:trigger factor
MSKPKHRELANAATSVIIERMETTRKNLSKTKVQLTITVGPKELEVAEQVALTKLAKEVKVPGFRAGKAPLSVVAKSVNPNALAEQTLDDALNRAIAEAFMGQKLQALDRPEVEVKKFVPGESLEFTAEVEILPEVKLGDYKHLSVVPEKTTVSAAEINEIIERMRQGLAVKKEVTRAAKDGDETIIDFVGKRDGVAFEGGTGKDYALTLGSHQFIPGFEEKIIGHKPGETFDIDLSFPKDYHAKDLAGQKVTFTVTLNKIEDKELPAVDDDFAKKAGNFTTVAQLKNDIKAELTKQKERQSTEKLRDQLIDKLIEVSTIPVPDILVNDQTNSLERDFAQNIAYQGLSFDDYLASSGYKDEDDWREKEVKPAAIRRVKAGLVLAELTRAENVTVTEPEIDEHVEVHKQQYANDPEALKQFDSPDVRRDIANHFITERTLDRLVDLNSKK